jgi:hypothetical protein
MKFQRTLVTLASLAVIGGVGLVASPADAAQAKPVTHSVATVSSVPSVVDSNRLPDKAATATGSITENYQCPVASDDGTTSARVCNGTWYAGTPGSRTFQMYLTLAQNRDSGWESIGLQWLKSLDGRQKHVYAYCQYKNGTSSALKANYIVGGNYANTLDFVTGRFYCDNYSSSDPVGYIFDVVASYGSGTWHTIITVGNPWIGGVANQYGHPERTCAC